MLGVADRRAVSVKNVARRCRHQFATNHPVLYRNLYLIYCSCQVCIALTTHKAPPSHRYLLRAYLTPVMQRRACRLCDLEFLVELLRDHRLNRNLPSRSHSNLSDHFQASLIILSSSNFFQCKQCPSNHLRQGEHTRDSFRTSCMPFWEKRVNVAAPLRGSMMVSLSESMTGSALNTSY